MTQTFNQKAQNIRDNTTNPNNSINESLIYDELILRSLTANSQNTDTILTEIKEYINGSLTNNIGGGADNPFWDVNGDYSDLKPYLNIITGLTVEQRNALGVIGTPSSQPVNTNTDNTANMIAVQKGMLGFLNGESVIDRDGSLQNPFFDTNGDYGNVAPYLKTIVDRLPQAAGLLSTKILLSAGTPYSITTTNTSQNRTLAVGSKGVSIYAVSSDVHFSIGEGSQIASVNSCYLPQGQRLDFDLTPFDNPNIAFIFGLNNTATIVKFNTLD